MFPLVMPAARSFEGGGGSETQQENHKHTCRNTQELHALVAKTHTPLHDLPFLQTVSPAVQLLVFVSQPTCTTQSAGCLRGKWLSSLLFIALFTFPPLLA